MPEMKKNRVKSAAKAGERRRQVGRMLAAVVGALALCSALPLSSATRCELGECSELTAPFEVHFSWTLAQPMNHLRVLGAAPEKDMASISPEAVQVHLTTRESNVGKQLVAEFEPERTALQGGQPSAYSPDRLVATRQGAKPLYHAELLGQVERRQPNGKRHTIRYILLSCELQDARGSVVYLQRLEVDAGLGSVDAVPCGATPHRYAALLPVRDYRSSAPTGLPEKYNGSPLRQDMLRLLYAMAAIDSPHMAATGTPEIAAFAWQLAARAPLPHSPWPDCWGDAAEDARSIARILTPTLVYFHENDCFDCQQLADFINSPLFARIFGESFTAEEGAPGEHVQEEPIQYSTLPRQ